MPRPWSQCRDLTRWVSAGSETISFDRNGIAHTSASGSGVIPWHDVLGLRIAVPISSSVTARTLPIVSALGPKPIAHAPLDLHFGIWTRIRLLEWTLPRPGRFSWRLQFTLDDLLDLLRARQDFSPLGRPGLLDAMVDEVASQLRPISRLMLNSDAPVLNRLIGHGSVDEELRILVDEYP